MILKGRDMKTAKEFVDEINAAELKTPSAAEDAIDSFCDMAKRVAEIDLDEHRWYVVGTVVYRIGDEFFGIRGPVSLKSEEMGFRDLDETCEAFEMEPVPSTTYQRRYNQ